MSINEKLDKIIELLEKIKMNVKPHNPWPPMAIRTCTCRGNIRPSGPWAFFGTKAPQKRPLSIGGPRIKINTKPLRS